MVQVSTRGSEPKVISRYRYNGLGYRIGWQYHHPTGIDDTFSTGIVDADPWYWLVYNDRWQQIAAYRVPGGSSSSWSGSAEARPKEIITHHMAGMDGRGGSSYIDSVVCRERDNALWGSAALSGTGASAWAIASRLYLLQNWRADVVMSVDSGGTIKDRIRYTAYGQPIRWSTYDIGVSEANFVPTGSYMADGAAYTNFINAFALGHSAADVNNDGTVDGSDYIDYLAAFALGDEGPLGPGNLSRDLDAGFRRGYAGYEFDPVLSAAGGGIYHVRNRVYDSETGRWDRRDPLGYVDGMGLYEYGKSMPAENTDPRGLASTTGAAGRGCTAAPPGGPAISPSGDMCIASSRNQNECINCCTVNNVTYLECARKCLANEWDPRIDPDRNPPDWNNPCRGNCWRFATCSPDPSNPVPANDPGGIRLPGCPTCDQLKDGMRRDGAVDPDSKTGSCPAGSYKIAVMLESGQKWCDYHFFRQNPDGRWQDKPGCTPVNPPFADPVDEWQRRRKENPSYYGNWCGYMCWPFRQRLSY